MGTNYYLHINKCPTCGTPEKILHIGKSSVGWAFSLHVSPDENINDLEDWKELFKLHPNSIVNEYGDSISFVFMLSTILDRKKHYGIKLLHNEVDNRYCIKNEDSYDLLIGDFSSS